MREIVWHGLHLYRPAASIMMSPPRPLTRVHMRCSADLACRRATADEQQQTSNSRRREAARVADLDSTFKRTKSFGVMDVRLPWMCGCYGRAVAMVSAVQLSLEHSTCFAFQRRTGWSGGAAPPPPPHTHTHAEGGGSQTASFGWLPRPISLMATVESVVRMMASPCPVAEQA
jgi:hypothetical protein